MPKIEPISAVMYAATRDRQADLSKLVAPPYDVLDETGKAALLARDERNIVAIDLPHLPPKTVGPPETYARAAEVYRKWLADGTLTRRTSPALFVYTQTYTVAGTTHCRKGLIANLPVQSFGPAADGTGGIFPHEQTFSGPKEDRLRLMRATQCQLSPIFGLYSDAESQVGDRLAAVMDAGPADFVANTDDGTRHEVWIVDAASSLSSFVEALAGRDVFIADGHHRYTTALNYREELRASGNPVPQSAQRCMFVLIAIEDPGMIVLPTHRLLGGMADFSFARFASAAAGQLKIDRFGGDLAALEAVLPDHGPHAIGLYDATAAGGDQLWLATTVDADPLAPAFPEATKAWRNLDVAIAQHLIVEQICEPTFCPDGGKVAWQFPHTLDELVQGGRQGKGQLGLVMQPTPLEAIGQVSEAGELMPQKSTFFYPKLATGLVLNPLA